MEKEIKELLKTVLSQQVILYKKLDNIENKLKNSSRLANLETYADELRREADKIKF